MKTYIKTLKNPFFSVSLLIVIWAGYLFLIQILSREFIPQKIGFLGSIPWSNFDGMHYISIARDGYFNYVQAFFPLYPILIKAVSQIISQGFVVSGLVVSYLSAFFAIFYFFKLLRLDYNFKISVLSLVFFLSFPSAFFLLAIYTEAVFLFLIFASFYFARKNRFLISGILAGLASATRLIGVLMLPALIYEAYKHKKNLKRSLVILFTTVPAGLLSYMYYLWDKFSDPLLFIHVQPGFGAGRSGGEIILLPQIFYRYFKIITTVPFSNYDFWIALLEILIFVIAFVVIYFAFKKNVRKSYIIFSSLALLLPTLSGTLSSIPRYAISSFVIFIGFALIKNSLLRYTILIAGIVLQGFLLALFLRGYFVS